MPPKQFYWNIALEKIHVIISEDPIEIDVVVTDKEIPWDVLQRALESDVAVVSSEWVIQCLITGKRVPYDSHPKYGHDYLEPSV